MKTPQSTTAASSSIVIELSIEFVETTAQATCAEGAKKILHINVTPFQANDTITFSSATEAKATVEKIDNRTVEVTGVDDGTSVITATNGTVSDTITFTVTAAAA